MKSNMKESHQFNILLPNNVHNFKDLDSNGCLYLFKDSINKLINELAKRTEFHKEIFNVNHGKPAKLNDLKDGGFPGFEFRIRLMVCNSLTEGCATRIDLIYNPEEK